MGDEGVKEAWEDGIERGWKRHHAAIESLDRRAVVGLLAATWRAHSAGGVGEHPGRFTVTEDDEKVTFTMNPCGSGQRLVRRGLYEQAGLRPHAGGARLVLRPQGLPALLHALLVHERVDADPVERLPALPVRPARGLQHRSLHLVLVQGPGRHPRAALAALRSGEAGVAIAGTLSGDVASLRGQLLVAGPSLIDPNFHRTVVLVCEHDEDGAMGLVLNRPSPIPADQAIPELGDALGAGGAAVARRPGADDERRRARRLRRRRRGDAGRRATSGSSCPTPTLEEVATAVHRARAFLGYAGWGAGPARRRARGRRLDRRRLRARGRVHRRARAALVARPRPQGRLVRAPRDDAARPVA